MHNMRGNGSGDRCDEGKTTNKGKGRNLPISQFGTELVDEEIEGFSISLARENGNAEIVLEVIASSHTEFSFGGINAIWREENPGFGEIDFLSRKRAEVINSVFSGMVVPFGGLSKKNEVVCEEEVREGWAVSRNSNPRP